MSLDVSSVFPGDLNLKRFNTKDIMLLLQNLSARKMPAEDSNTLLHLADIANDLDRVKKDIDNPLPAYIAGIRTILGPSINVKGSQSSIIQGNLVAFEANTLNTVIATANSLAAEWGKLSNEYFELAKSGGKPTLDKILDLEARLQKFDTERAKPFKESIIAYQETINDTYLRTQKDTILKPLAEMMAARAEEMAAPAKVAPAAAPAAAAPQAAKAAVAPAAKPAAPVAPVKPVGGSTPQGS